MSDAPTAPAHAGDYGRRAELAALWGSAGLGDVATSRLVAEAGYEDFEDLCHPMTIPDGVIPSPNPSERRA